MNISPPARRRAPAPKPIIAPRARTRAVQQVAAKPQSKAPWHVPVVGGPKVITGYGMPIFTEGRPINQWPYKTGSDFAGWKLDEYVHTAKGKIKTKMFHDGTDISYVKTHIWQFRDGALRYMGGYNDRESATNRVLTAFARQAAEQVVAPPARRRRP